MNRLRQILKDRRGVAFPLIIAIVLVLVMLMCCISEYFRLLIVAQGVRDAVQEAVISTVNDNYDDVYHGVREGTPAPTSRWREILRNHWTMAISMDAWTISLG